MQCAHKTCRNKHKEIRARKGTPQRFQIREISKMLIISGGHRAVKLLPKYLLSIGRCKPLFLNGFNRNLTGFFYL